MKQRTFEEEQIRQMKILSMQKAPLGVFVKLGFYIFLGLTVLGLLAKICLIF